MNVGYHDSLESLRALDTRGVHSLSTGLFNRLPVGAHEKDWGRAGEQGEPLRDGEA